MSAHLLSHGRRVVNLAGGLRRLVSRSGELLAGDEDEEIECRELDLCGDDINVQVPTETCEYPRVGAAAPSHFKSD